MSSEHWSRGQGVLFALASAILFGASTPLSKLLLGRLEPVPLAGVLYLGSGLGLGAIRAGQSLLRKGAFTEAPLKASDLPWLAGAILAGGVAGPILLMVGLTSTPASTASLLLNLEGVFTASLAWWVFRESYDRRIALGMAFIVVGGLVLSWNGHPKLGVPWGSVSILGACLAWAIDNNLTRKVSAADPLQIAAL